MEPEPTVLFFAFDDERNGMCGVPSANFPCEVDVGPDVEAVSFAITVAAGSEAEKFDVSDKVGGL